jgi:long-chain fatty acid transport protein
MEGSAMNQPTRLSAVLTLALLTAAGGTAHGAGFALIEQSAKGMGQAFAGAGTDGEDASSIYFNPAAMSLQDSAHLDAALHLILPSAKFENQGSSIGGVFPLSGGNGGDGGEAALVPNLNYILPLNNKVTAGIGVYVPFGLATSYDKDWVGRYQAVDSELETLNINPSIAYQVNDKVSIGAGLNAQYAKADLSSAVDFGSIGTSVLGAGPAGALGLAPQSADGMLDVTGDDWGVGYNLGILLQPQDGTRVGLSYRSSVDYTLRGDADFTVPAAAAPLTAQGLFTDTDAKADLTVPADITLGLYQELNDKWAILGTVKWTEWSSFDELRVEYDGFQPDSVVEEDWEDVMFYSVGARYIHTDTLTWRAGMAYDEAPVPGADRRTPRIPDNDRLWIALGASIKATETVTVDVSYAHLFIDDADTRTVGPSGDVLVGEWESSVDLISVQVSMKL